jgi:hypothetical protein
MHAAIPTKTTTGISSEIAGHVTAVEFGMNHGAIDGDALQKSCLSGCVS